MSVITLVVVAVNVVAYGAKLFLRSNGVSVGWFTRHFRDFGSLKALAEHGDTERVRLAASRWLLALRISVGAFVVALVVAFTIFFVADFPWDY